MMFWQLSILQRSEERSIPTSTTRHTLLCCFHGTWPLLCPWTWILNLCLPCLRVCSWTVIKCYKSEIRIEQKYLTIFCDNTFSLLQIIFSIGLHQSRSLFSIKIYFGGIFIPSNHMLYQWCFASDYGVDDRFNEQLLSCCSVHRIPCTHDRCVLRGCKWRTCLPPGDSAGHSPLLPATQRCQSQSLPHQCVAL